MRVIVLVGLLLTGCASRQPNIVLILADDLGVGDVGAYNPASKIATPYLDRFASEAVRFSDAHAPASVCTPTRYALMTGRYAWRTALKKGVLDGYSPALIPSDQETFASIARRKGYATAVIGKWHLGLGTTDYSQPIAAGPLTVGFDYFFGLAASLDMPPYAFLENDRAVAVPTEEAPLVRPDRDGGGAWWRRGSIAPGFRHVDVLPEITKRAVAYVSNAREPFFLYVPLTAPHTPWVPSPEFAGRSNIGPYGDFVMQTDDSIGRIVAAIDRSGKKNRTIVIVTSDNGALIGDRASASGHRSNLHFRGQKSELWEGGMRVPLMIRWPGGQSGESKVAVSLVDLLPTVAAYADLDYGGGDGVNWTSVDHMPPTVYQSLTGDVAIRKGKWKLIVGGGLFDLEADPEESRDVSDANPGLVEELKRDLLAIQKEVSGGN